MVMKPRAQSAPIHCSDHLAPQLRQGAASLDRYLLVVNLYFYPLAAIAFEAAYFRMCSELGKFIDKAHLVGAITTYHDWRTFIVHL